MKIPKQAKSLEGQWAKSGKDVKDGDRIKLMNSGVIDDSGNFGPKHVFKIMTTRKEEFNLSINRTSLNNLAEGFGEESDNWVGKVVKAFVIRQMVGDGLKNVLYLAPEGWVMNDEGQFESAEAKNKAMDAVIDEVDAYEVSAF